MGRKKRQKGGHVGWVGMAEVIKSAALVAVTTAEKKIRPGDSWPTSEALTRLASSAAGAVDLTVAPELGKAAVTSPQMLVRLLRLLQHSEKYLTVRA